MFDAQVVSVEVVVVIFGVWNPNNEEIQNYIQEIIKADMEESGNEDVFRKIQKDFKSASVKVEDSEIRNQMEKALSRAKEDFK